MKKKSVWVASDGTEFTDQDACIIYERSEGFRHATVGFVQKHLEVSEEQATELVTQLSDFWNLIRDNPEDFQKVLDLAKPRKRRGRPPTKKKAKQNTDEPAKEDLINAEHAGHSHKPLVGGALGAATLGGAPINKDAAWLKGNLRGEMAEIDKDKTMVVEAVVVGDEESTGPNRGGDAFEKKKQTPTGEWRAGSK